MKTSPTGLAACLKQPAAVLFHSEAFVYVVHCAVHVVMALQVDPVLRCLAEKKVELIYDLRSRKRSMTDPRMGYWEYKYSVLGEFIYQVDTKSQTITSGYRTCGLLYGWEEILMENLVRLID
ncbi:MAG: hypothetical protein M3A44_13315 [Gammaproteobacteria bacterium]